nr:NADPH--cytochrome P450 reductase [Arenicola marina]
MLITQASGTTGEAAMFGVLDILVLGGVAGVALYWFVLRKKKEEPPVIKSLYVGPTPADKNGMSNTSFISKMKNSGKNVIVFYGSQTGTAEEFAGRLSKDASRYGMKGLAADPEECDMEDLTKLADIENSLAIFCVATYGEGDPTDNAQEFYDWLQDGAEPLSGLNYAVFGLGNKTYEHFNAMGKFVDTKLEELGAHRVYELGSGDDDGNIEEDFVTWREKFWPAVCENFGITSIGEEMSMRQYAVTVHDETVPDKVFTGEPARHGSFKTQRPLFDAKNPFLSPVNVNRELHHGGDRSCMHIEFDITGSKIRYDAGDHVAVFPTNDPDLVERMGKRLGADLGQVISLTNVDPDASKKHPFPCPTTYRTALLHYLDVTHALRTNVLKELLEYTEDEKDKAFLTKITSSTPEGKELYNEWVLKDHRTMLDVLEDLPSLKPPIDHVCELLPRLQARYYSIASSPKMNPTSVHITAVLVEWQSRAGRQQKGVATNWLKLKRPVGEEKPKVPIYVRKSQFRLPFKPSVPVIMVGPGTGLAPFRGFIQDRHQAKEEGKPVGEAILYFGCRKRAEDFIYEDELERYQADGTLSKIHLAFSRDQAEKLYVQHLLRQNQAETWRILEAGGHIYVCGDARHMAHDVDQALQEIVINEGHLDSNAAVDYLKRLRTRGRYSCDVWS